jgi:hypothetical protein
LIYNSCLPRLAHNKKAYGFATELMKVYATA